ncbi:hypothetical protein [Nocardia sp. IFM 10818]
MPVTEPRGYLAAQQRLGRTIADIAAAADLPLEVVRVVARHERTGVDAEVAARIMAVGYGPLPGAPHGPALGAQRRVRALLAMGWHPTALADHCDTEVIDALPALLADLTEDRQIPAAVWHGIARAFDALAMTPGPDPALRDTARDLGYATPLAWDEDEIDDPRGRPHYPQVRQGIDPVAIHRRLGLDHTVTLLPAEIDVILDLAVRDHWTADHLADVLGGTRAAAERRLTRRRNRTRIDQPGTETSRPPAGTEPSAPAAHVTSTSVGDTEGETARPGPDATLGAPAHRRCPSTRSTVLRSGQRARRHGRARRWPNRQIRAVLSGPPGQPPRRLPTGSPEASSRPGIRGVDREEGARLARSVTGDRASGHRTLHPGITAGLSPPLQTGSAPVPGRWVSFGRAPRRRARKLFAARKVRPNAVYVILTIDQRGPTF